jgi:hypothetical protein
MVGKGGRNPGNNLNVSFAFFVMEMADKLVNL